MSESLPTIADTPTIRADTPASAPPPSSPGAPPQRPAGARYDIAEEIGRGGMAVVYRAQDKGLGREVAMKLLLHDLEADPALRARFVEEARATAQLQHPAIVPIHEIGEDERGRLFFTMKLVRGRTLADVVAKRDLTRFRLLQIVIDVARAVAFAHERGFIHRDLKPHNVMIGEYGEVQVMDWGLARITARKVGESGERAGAVIGTPAYMPPEQAEGGAVGPAADVYALGATLYHVLARRAPYERGAPAEIVFKVLHEEPPRPRDLDATIPRDLEAICLRAMARAAADRYPSAQAFADDLQAHLEQRPVAAYAEGIVERALRTSRRHRAVAITLAAAFIVLFAGGVVALVRINRERRAAEERAIEARANLAQVFVEKADRAMKESDGPGAEVLLLRALELGAPRAARELLLHARIDAAPVRWSRLTQIGLETFVFLPGGKRVIQGGQRGISIYDIATGAEVATTGRYADHIAVGQLLPDGKRIATAGSEGILRLHDIETAALLAESAPTDAIIAHPVASPDGRSLATVDHLGTIRIYEAADLRLRATVRGLPEPAPLILTLEYAADSARLFAGMSNGEVRVFDARTLDVLHVVPPAGRRAPGKIQLLSRSDDGRWLGAIEVHAGGIYVLRMIDLARGAQVWEADAHDAGVNNVAFSRDGKTIATAAWDRAARLWDRESGIMVAEWLGRTAERVGVALDGDEGLILMAGYLGVLERWDPRKDAGRTLRIPGGVERISVSPDGRRLAVQAPGAAPVEVRIPPDAIRPEVVPLERPGDVPWVVLTREIAPGTAATCEATSPDGRVRAAGGADEIVRRGDVATGAEQLLRGHESWVRDVSFSPDGRWIVSCGDDRTARLWNARTGAEEFVVRGQIAWVRFARFSADGSRLVTAGADGLVRIYETAALRACMEGSAEELAAGAERRGVRVEGLGVVPVEWTPGTPLFGK